MILYDLFINFLLVGIFTFGSGYSSIPLIKDVVLTNHWLTEEIYLNIVAIAETTPGPVMVNTATYVGYKMAGLLGGILATTVAIFPAFLVILLFAKYFRNYLFTNKAKYFFSLVRPAVCAVIFATGIELLFKNILRFFSFKELAEINFMTAIYENDILKRMIILAILILVLLGYKKITKKDLKTIPYIIISAIIGIIVLY